MRAKIISAFPACGKTTFFNKCKEAEELCYMVDKFKVLDSDSSLFSWIYDENGNKTDVRNPEFPSNYINHIKENMETADIIFVSTHKAVRDALREEGIKYYLVYPDIDLKQEWINRFVKRGNTFDFIKLQTENWEKFIGELEEETFPNKIILMTNDGIIDNKLITSIMNGVHDNCTSVIFPETIIGDMLKQHNIVKGMSDAIKIRTMTSSIWLMNNILINQRVTEIEKMSVFNEETLNPDKYENDIAKYMCQVYSYMSNFVDISDMSKDDADDFRFITWTDEENEQEELKTIENENYTEEEKVKKRELIMNQINLKLIPYYMIPFLKPGMELIDIFGEKIIYNGIDSIDIDIRFGCLSYGIKLK